MRRLVILALLFGGMQLVLVAGPAEGFGEALLAFGFLILAAYSVGELMKQFNLPKLVGYLAAGAIFGPSALAAVPAEAVADLSPVSDLAIALIAFLAGAELEWGELRRRGVALLKVTGIELTVTFLVIFGALLLMREFVPFLQGTNTLTTLTFAGLFASIAIVHSPAVTMALLTETGARGPLSRTTLGVVLLADVVVVLVFSAALSAAQSLVPSGGEGVGSLGATVWEIGGAIPIGALLGGAVALYLRFVRGELFLFALLVTFFGLEISRLAHVETLLTLLVAGFVAETAAPGRSGRALRHAMERSAAPVFVVFFALAGAKLEIAELIALWPVVIPIVLARAFGIWTGTRIGARVAGIPRAESDTLWMGLISQAGVAIGLVTVAEQAYPAVGGTMRTILLSVIAVNETVGAVFFRRALARAGEINAKGAAGFETPLGKRESGAVEAPST
ncbi:MAG TPA: cation:proton antiporter [Gemmatimonadales bacterium]|nr:cation:proton antiporter [Gemmatimonadales bacterium]